MLEIKSLNYQQIIGATKDFITFLKIIKVDKQVKTWSFDNSA